jgi:hypothetical protein
MVGLQVISGDGRYLQPHLLPISQHDCIQNGVIVHHVKLGDSRDDLPVEGKDHVALLERECGWGALNLSYHEQLVPFGVGGFDAPDPVYRRKKLADVRVKQVWIDDFGDMSSNEDHGGLG